MAVLVSLVPRQEDDGELPVAQVDEVSVFHVTRCADRHRGSDSADARIVARFALA